MEKPPFSLLRHGDEMVDSPGHELLCPKHCFLCVHLQSVVEQCIEKQKNEKPPWWTPMNPEENHLAEGDSPLREKPHDSKAQPIGSGAALPPDHEWEPRPTAKFQLKTGTKCHFRQHVKKTIQWWGRVMTLSSHQQSNSQRGSQWCL